MFNKLFWRFFNALIKRTLWPISRLYSQYLIGDKPADLFLQFISSITFWNTHRYWPNFKKPKSFSEKIFHRMLFNRNPKLTILSDKYACRNFIKKIIGEEYLVPLLWSGEKTENIPFGDLPKKFVIKTNHGCSYNLIVKDKASLNIECTKQQLDLWLTKNFTNDILFGLQWAYKNITPCIIIEQFIGSGDKEPIDYKFFCFQGKALFVQTNYDRFGDAKENIFDREYNFLDIWNGLPSDRTKIEKPQNYKTMLHIADTLSKDFDFIRVDLYNIDAQIYVGELTCYPAGGLAPFVPRSYDYIFGKNWNIKA